MAAFRFRSCPLICVGLLLLTLGCAPAYQSYQCECSCIPYGYCHARINDRVGVKQGR